MKAALYLDARVHSFIVYPIANKCHMLRDDFSKIPKLLFALRASTLLCLDCEKGPHTHQRTMKG